MKQSLHGTLFILCTIFTLNSCSPVPITRIEVDNEEVGYWNRGQGVGQIMHQDLVFDLIYSHVVDDFVFFDVAVSNNGKDPYLVDARDIRLKDVLRGGVFKAVDPEIYLLDREIRSARRDARNKTVAVMGAAAVVAGTIAVVANTDSSGDGEADDNCIEQPQSIVVVNDNMAAQSHIQDFSQMEIGRDIPYHRNPKNFRFWRDYALRKTTLFEGDYVRGLIGFMHDEKREEMLLSITVDGKEYQVGFKQKLYK